MGFKIEKANNARRNMPEGRYIFLEGIDWLITEITINNSGSVCLKLHDPIRKENQVKTLCTLEELIQATVTGAVYKEL
jgi:hypothetical protein